MKIGLFGAGKLGNAIALEASHAPDLELAWQLDAGQTPSGPVDVAIDASVAEAVPEHLAWAVETGTDLVIGATGWHIPDLKEKVGARIGVLVAPNFSLSVALMGRLATILARYGALGMGEPFVLEHHHSQKADAPSGTAKMLAASVLSGYPQKKEWTLGTPATDQLSVGVLRAGSEFGMHVVGLDGPAETLEIKHQARSRGVFAQGALHAARFIRGKNGVFSFSDLAAEVLDPLFK